MQLDRMAVKIETEPMAKMVCALMEDPYLTWESVMDYYLVFNYTRSIPYTIMSKELVNSMWEHVVLEGQPTVLRFLRLMNED